ncbi:hypothetical protein B0H14DRAFT_3470850 [Mycena olivaceomarginata]|nr:hypothetical protein B0H14DRAFT_3470850 [Mycena olivaceomarginata]
MASEAIPVDPVLLAKEAPPEAPRRHGDTVEITVLNGASTQIGDTALARETPAAALPPTSSSPSPDASTYPPRQGETRVDYEPPLTHVTREAPLLDACAHLALKPPRSANLERLRSELAKYWIVSFDPSYSCDFRETRKGHGVVSECILVRGEVVLDQKTRLLVCGGEFVDCGICGRVDAVGGGGALDGRANVLRMGGAILEGSRGRAVAQDAVPLSVYSHQVVVDYAHYPLPVLVLTGSLDILNLATPRMVVDVNRNLEDEGGAVSSTLEAQYPRYLSGS